MRQSGYREPSVASGTNKRGFALGIAVSFTIHFAAAALLRASADGGEPAGGSDPILLTDIDVPPEPPEAHDPVEEEMQPPSDELEPEVEVEPEPEATLEPLPEPDEVAELVMDAGVEEDATEVAELTPDAGLDEDAAAEIAEVTSDAGVEEDGAVEVAEAERDAGMQTEELALLAGDAGSEAAAAVAATLLDGGGLGADAGARVAAQAGGLDAGVAVASRTRGGPVPSWVDGTTPSEAETSVDRDGGVGGGAPAPPGAASNLLAYFPPGEVITVLLRLDRFRATPWAQRMEAVVRPMPDYQAIVGSRNVLFSDLFDTLIITSPRPQDLAATTLVGRYASSDAKVRRFLNHRESRVVWRSVRGGVVGRRARSPLVLRRDPRVFLMPYPGMVMLAPPSYLGSLLEPSPVPLGAARADDAVTPEWIKRVRSIELESGVDTGPAVLLTMAGIPQQIEIPMVGKIPAPERATLAAEITTGGFLLRGNLLFSTEARAVEFMAFAGEKQKWLVGTVRGRLLLSPFNAFNAVKGLSLKRKGDKVAYATSISVADGRAMLDYAAKWATAFFPSLLPTPAGQNRAAPGGRRTRPDKAGHAPGRRDKRP